ncbi:MAG: OPT family oligopeptide transporter [Candidatus Eisenbacteria bacterium]|nr:OPT family oligopeptide transporter [Candidatus Eisenbacteria bacterium]
MAEEPRKTPEQIEREWYENVYKGAGDSMKQLTVRAVVMGSFLGSIMSLTNLYIGLKTGWGLGVAITSCILSYAIWKGLRAAFPFWLKTDFTILENNCMQSTASAAGYSVGGTIVSAIAAMLMITGTHMSYWVLLGWNIFLGIIGVVMAVPMKRQMINIEQLKFPSGIAAAETLRSLHSSGAGAVRKARALGLAGLSGALVAWFRDATFRFMPFNMPASLPFGNLSISGIPLQRLTLSWDMGLIMIAAGAIIGFRTAWSMLLGALVNYAILVPAMVQRGVIYASNPEAGVVFRDMTRWSLWIGVSMMVVSSFVALSFHARTIGRAFMGLVTIFTGGPKAKRDDPLAKIEVPSSWFITIFLIGMAGVVIMQAVFWDIPVYMGILSVLLTFVLSVVACRATGETDITPVGALGKVTQLTYGVIAPSNMTTNIMTASVTANASGCAADLLVDLKSGYILGANARKQFIAQFIGLFPGAFVIGAAWILLVPNAEALGTDKFPAPAAQVWRGVAELLSKGISSLHPTARVGALIGGILGLAIPLAERGFPRYRKYIPSAMGLGLAFVIQGFNAISMFVGALIVLMLGHWYRRVSEDYTIPVASGIIAGESIMAVITSVLGALGVPQK